ncbi:MAG: membrane AbrB-like protein [Sulfitobacter sp.]|jgi:membrane AbrB-like protein
MNMFSLVKDSQTTLSTLLVAIAGAVFGWALNAPVYMLLGPALAVTLAGLSGLRTGIDARLRDLCFLALGIAVGAGFDGNALAAMMRWPLAFVFMCLIIWAILVLCRIMLVRVFDFDPRSAVLAAAPGHLSFVIAIATEGGSDVARISITQSVRLLSLTLVVPFIALAMGIEVSGNVAPQGTAMTLPLIAVLIALSAVVGFLFIRWQVPAPLLLAGMAVSALGHVTEWTPGVLPAWLILPAYLVLGALIGTRFSGISLSRLASGLSAGLAITLVAVALAGLAAIPVGMALGMPLAHVLVAFAPGGFETMIAMGAVLGVTPGFVAACHIMRLVVLSLLLPAMLSRLKPATS